MNMMKPLLTAAIVAALGTNVAHAVETNVIVDINNNLYYTGLYAKNAQGDGSQIPPLNYPNVALAANYYQGTNIFDCVRTELDGLGTSTNTHLDVRRSCFGAEAEVLDLSAVGVAAGETLYVRVAGIIDPDTVNDYKAPNSSSIPAVDARGQLDAIDTKNELASYSLIGVWASSADASLVGSNEAVAAADANGDGFNDIFDSLADHGFEENGTEFGIVEELGLTPTGALVDANDDGVADVGSIFEFKGSTTVPAGATHLILAYNGHRGGYYHHGDPGYIGQSHPLYDLLTSAQRTEQGLLDNVSSEVDNFVGDAGFDGQSGSYAAGDPRAVGVFMVTADDEALPSLPLISAPTSTFSYTKDGLAAAFDASASTANSGTILRYVWDFGDQSDSVSTTSPTVQHTFGSAQAYTVTLTVMNNYSVSAQSKQNVSLSTSSGGSGGGGGGGAFGLLGLLPMIGLMRRRRRS